MVADRVSPACALRRLVPGQRMARSMFGGGGMGEAFFYSFRGRQCRLHGPQVAPLDRPRVCESHYQTEDTGYSTDPNATPTEISRRHPKPMHVVIALGLPC